MEDDLYLCKWKRTRAGYRLWLKGRPWVSVKGDEDVHVLAEQLSMRISRSGRAQHAVLEFEKPLPHSAFDARYRTPELVTVSGGIDTFEATLTEDERHQRWRWWNHFFQKPACRTCEGINSVRNETPFSFDHFPSASDGGHVCCGTTTLYVYSDRFLDQLSASEKAGLQFRPVTLTRTSRNTFYELIGPSGPPFVGLTTLEAPGSTCESCGLSLFGHWSSKSAIHDFVAASDLPAKLPGVFTVGTAPRLGLCMTAERWAEILPHTRRLSSSPLGVVPDADLVRVPESTDRNSRDVT